MTETAANIGVVGVVVMGPNLAQNLAIREVNTAAVFNWSSAKTEALVSEQSFGARTRH